MYGFELAQIVRVRKYYRLTSVGEEGFKQKRLKCGSICCNRGNCPYFKGHEIGNQFRIPL
jgi:hypothetical protein